MNECKKCESLFEKALYDELGDQEKEFFNKHLSSCKNCAGDDRHREIVRRRARDQLSRLPT